RRRQQRDEHANERRLPRAVRAEQTEDFAVLHGEADAVDGGEVAELLDEAVDFDRVHLFVALFRFQSGNNTYAVIPTARRRSRLSTRRRTSNVLMSRLVRLTSRCVANDASTPGLKHVPSRTSVDRHQMR